MFGHVFRLPSLTRCHVFYPTVQVFGHVFRLAELEDLLDEEVVYLELVRRPPAGPDAVLAAFETSARELLFPTGTGVVRPSRSGADLDLLMEPTEHFVVREGWMGSVQWLVHGRSQPGRGLMC